MRVALSKHNSTKAERIFAELLRKHHIPFKHRERFEGKEVDFIIGKYAIEIDGHGQSRERNAWLVKLGYSPLHFANRLMRDHPDKVEAWITQKLKK